jgi:hypothetical protein
MGVDVYEIIIDYNSYVSHFRQYQIGQLCDERGYGVGFRNASSETKDESNGPTYWNFIRKDLIVNISTGIFLVSIISLV